MRAELFHADRHTQVRKIIVASLNFTNAPRNNYSTTRTYQTLLENGIVEDEQEAASIKHCLDTSVCSCISSKVLCACTLNVGFARS